LLGAATNCEAEIRRCWVISEEKVARSGSEACQETDDYLTKPVSQTEVDTPVYLGVAASYGT
jgi:hypothetical protein